MAEATKAAIPTEMQTTITQVVMKHSHLDPLKWANDAAKLKVDKSHGDGVNDMYRVYLDNDNTNSVIIKHILPYGPEDSQEQQHDREEVEWKALNKFESLAPGSVVKPFFYDRDSKLLCLEDLRDYDIYRNSMIDSNLDDDAALKLARDMAIIHRDTHIAKIGEAAIKDLDTQFKNASTLASREHDLFTAPFSRDDPTNRCSDAVKARLDWLYEDQEVVQAASNMKKVFLEKKEALVHGDLHTGSIMVKDKDARLTNAGFSYVGPCSLDMGLLIANYIFAHYRHMMCPEDNDAHRVIAYRMVEVCNHTVDEYLSHMTAVGEDSEMYQARFISEVAGFAGCEIIRRLVGAHHVAEFDQVDDAEVDTLGAGVRLLKAYHRIHSIGTLMLIALMLA